MESFQLKQSGSLRYLELAHWSEDFCITAGFSSREGGISDSCYGSLNCGLHVHDAPGRVVENRRRIAESVQIPFENWTYAEQVHGTRIVDVTSEMRGRGRKSMDTAIRGADGLITSEKGICLASVYADCVPLYYFDPEHQVIGIAHAGWKGTVNEMAARMIEHLQQNHDTKADQLLAAIGPSIGGCCYEVDKKVIDPVNKLIQTYDILENTVYQRSGGDKYMLNLQEMNRQIMIKAGISPSHIEISNLCTSCEDDLFFSFRRDKGKTGRMQAWIGFCEGNGVLSNRTAAKH